MRHEIIRFVLVFSLLICCASPSFAGGSWDPVRIQKLTMLSDTDYVLIIEPQHQLMRYKNAFFGDCSQFVVNGTYSRLDDTPWLDSLVRKTPIVTLEDHLAALEKLKAFESEGAIFEFGYMGTGFNVIDPDTPCVVESRALEVWIEGDKVAIISYFRHP